MDDMGTAPMLDDAMVKVRAAFEGVPEGDRLAQQIETRFRREYESPPLRDLEQIIGENLTAEAARFLLFAPREDQIKHYCALLGNPSPAVAQDHSLRKVQPFALTLLFLVHRSNWTGFLRHFVAAGGLETLAELLVHQNLTYRGQALEILLGVVDTDNYDWFKLPQDALETALHFRLLRLSREDCPFVENLVANRNAQFPGGSFRSLQLLAFWLSWLRAMYAHGQGSAQAMRVSARLVNELELWSEPVRKLPAVQEEGEEGEEEGQTTAGASFDGAGSDPSEPAVQDYRSPEEIEFAQRVFEDFGHGRMLPVAPAAHAPTPTAATGATDGSRNEGGNAAGEGVTSSAPSGPSADQTVPVVIVEEETTVAFARVAMPDEDAQNALESNPYISASAGAVVRLQALKKAANDVFVAGELQTAIQEYQKAIDAFGDMMRVATTEGWGASARDELREIGAQLHNNRATALFRLAGNARERRQAQSDGKQSKAEQRTEADWLQEAQTDCEHAIQIQPGYSKAQYRLAQILRHRGEFVQAKRVIEQALGMTPGSSLSTTTAALAAAAATDSRSCSAPQASKETRQDREKRQESASRERTALAELHALLVADIYEESQKQNRDNVADATAMHRASSGTSNAQESKEPESATTSSSQDADAGTEPRKPPDAEQRKLEIMQRIMGRAPSSQAVPENRVASLVDCDDDPDAEDERNGATLRGNAGSTPSVPEPAASGKKAKPKSGKSKAARSRTREAERADRDRYANLAGLAPGLVPNGKKTKKTKKTRPVST